MDISVRCPCSSRLALVDAPEAMACHTVAEWNLQHAGCVEVTKTLMIMELEEEDEFDDEGVPTAQSGDEDPDAD